MVIAWALLGLAHAQSTTPNEQEIQRLERDIERMEREQEALVQQIKRELQRKEDSPRKEELKAKLALIERSMRAPQDRYISPSSKLTPAMAAYYERMKRRLEDCGTRHFPNRDGAKVHGAASVAVTLDRGGRLVSTEVLRSSGELVVDRHIPKLVSASAPFGAIPAELDRAGRPPIRHLVVVSEFAFTRDEAPPPDSIPESERCRWK